MADLYDGVDDKALTVTYDAARGVVAVAPVVSS
jgi:hypothetical protein